MKQFILIGLVVAALLSSTMASSNDGSIVHQQSEASGDDLSRPEPASGNVSNNHNVLEEMMTTLAKLIKRDTKEPGRVEDNSESTLIKLNEARGQKKPTKDINGLHLIGDFLKLILNPVELTKRISVTFRLDYDKLSSMIGKNVLFGLEAALTPPLASTKIVEKVFVPDACALKFVCSMGSHLAFLKVHVLKLSSKIIEGTKCAKALTDGIIGRDCGAAYPSCANNMLTVQKEVKDKAALALANVVSSGGKDQAVGSEGEQFDSKSPLVSKKEALKEVGSFVTDQVVESINNQPKLFGLF